MLQQDGKFFKSAGPTKQWIQTESDPILEALERWKKRTIAAFLLSSLLIAVAAVLLFEAGGVVKVWQVEFGYDAKASTSSNSKANGCEVPSPATSLSP